MSKVVAIMSMSLDGYIADPNDGVAEVFDWYFTSGDVEIHTGGSDPSRCPGRAPSTFAVSSPDLVPCSPVDALSRSPKAGAEITPGDRHSFLATTSPPDGRDPTRLSTS
jgi:hypothetical protein